MREIQLTAQQGEFVLHFTSMPGCIGNATASARAAGYSDRSAAELGRQLLEKPHVRAAVDEALRRQISGPAAAKAAALLERVVDDETAPLRLRLDAARTILDRAGIVTLPALARSVGNGDQPADAPPRTLAEAMADAAEAGALLDAVQQLREAMRGNSEVVVEH
jgi:hypothetical protein